MSVALDANLLVYASDESSAFQTKAAATLEELSAGPDPCYAFWPVVMAYLRIATHPSLFDRPLSLSRALDNVEALLERPAVRTPAEEEGFLADFRAVAGPASVRGNLVTDAHVVALMRQYGVRTIVSHDSDFRKFDDILVKDPFA